MTNTTEHSDPEITEAAAVIAELWRQWLAATAAYHAASITDTQAALRAHDDAELLALRIATIPALSVDDTRYGVMIVAWLRQYSTGSHAETTLESAIAADLDRLHPPLS